MLSYVAAPGSGIVEIVAEGRISREDLIAVFEKLDADIARHGSLRVLERIGALDGIELSAIWEDLKLGLAHMGKISRAAIVADQGWVKAATGLVRHLIPMEVRHFAPDRLDEAREWIAAP